MAIILQPSKAHAHVWEEQKARVDQLELLLHDREEKLLASEGGDKKAKKESCKVSASRSTSTDGTKSEWRFRLFSGSDHSASQGLVETRNGCLESGNALRVEMDALRADNEKLKRDHEQPKCDVKRLERELQKERHERQEDVKKVTSPQLSFLITSLTFGEQKQLFIELMPLHRHVLLDRTQEKFQVL